jgi:hypothetical protein
MRSTKSHIREFHRDPRDRGAQEDQAMSIFWCSIIAFAGGVAIGGYIVAVMKEK